MRKLLILLLLSCPYAFSQYSVPGAAGSAVSITQGGNTASVDASGRLSVGLNAVGGTSITLGQKAMSASLPIVLASDQGSVGVTFSNSTIALSAGSALVGGLQIVDSAGTNKLAVDATGKIALSNTAFGISAGTALVGKIAPATSCGVTVRDTGAVALTNTTAAPAVMNATTCVLKIFISNIDTSTHTFTLTDGQGSPVTYISAFTLAAKSTYLLDLSGMSFTTGIKWNADAGAVVIAQAIGLQ